MDLLSLFKKEQTSYYGSGSYRFVERLIKNEKNILIVSPYVDEYYARYLANHSHGRQIYVISSSMKEEASKQLRSSKMPVALRFGVLIFSFNALLFLSGFLFPYLILASVLSLITLILWALPRDRKIFLKVPKSFIHAKMYVGDGSAIEGSANLTYAGMHKNIERINMVADPARIKEMKKEFWKLWDSQ